MQLARTPRIGPHHPCYVTRTDGGSVRADLCGNVSRVRIMALALAQLCNAHKMYSKLARCAHEKLTKELVSARVIDLKSEAVYISGHDTKVLTLRHF